MSLFKLTSTIKCTDEQTINLWSSNVTHLDTWSELSPPTHDTGLQTSHHITRLVNTILHTLQRILLIWCFYISECYNFTTAQQLHTLLRNLPSQFCAEVSQYRALLSKMSAKSNCASAKLEGEKIQSNTVQWIEQSIFINEIINRKRSNLIINLRYNASTH